MRGEHVFRDRLLERFGARAEGFSDHLMATLGALWDLGRTTPEAPPGSRGFPPSYMFRMHMREQFGERENEFPKCIRDRLHALWKDGMDFGGGRMCARCGSREDVRFEGARTAYCETEESPDPNADIPYCRPCAEDHHDYWDEMWAEYRSSQGAW